VMPIKTPNLISLDQKPFFISIPDFNRIYDFDSITAVLYDFYLLSKKFDALPLDHEFSKKFFDQIISKINSESRKSFLSIFEVLNKTIKETEMQYGDFLLAFVNLTNYVFLHKYIIQDKAKKEQILNPDIVVKNILDDYEKKIRYFDENEQDLIQRMEQFIFLTINDKDVVYKELKPDVLSLLQRHLFEPPVGKLLDLAKIVNDYIVKLGRVVNIGEKATLEEMLDEAIKQKDEAGINIYRDALKPPRELSSNEENYPVLLLRVREILINLNKTEKRLFMYLESRWGTSQWKAGIKAKKREEKEIPDKKKFMYFVKDWQSIIPASEIEEPDKFWPILSRIYYGQMHKFIVTKTDIDIIINPDAGDDYEG